MSKKKELSIEEIIDLAVTRAAFKTERDINYYAATESILENYLRLKETVQDFQDYIEAMYNSKSKSITSFSAASGYRDQDDIIDERMAERAKAFEKTKDQLFVIDNALKRFTSTESFKVIEMYYFNLNEDGTAREEDERLTFAEIADKLGKSEKTIRAWRTKLVKDMSFILFGIPAATKNNDLTRRKKG